ncbi:hypothetical protein EV715DRAFT_268338 [Schizophyllum commune]
MLNVSIPTILVSIIWSPDNSGTRLVWSKPARQVGSSEIPISLAPEMSGTSLTVCKIWNVGLFAPDNSALQIGPTESTQTMLGDAVTDGGAGAGRMKGVPLGQAEGMEWEGERLVLGDIYKTISARAQRASERTYRARRMQRPSAQAANARSRALFASADVAKRVRRPAVVMRSCSSQAARAGHGAMTRHCRARDRRQRWRRRGGGGGKKGGGGEEERRRPGGGGEEGRRRGGEEVEEQHAARDQHERDAPTRLIRLATPADANDVRERALSACAEDVEYGRVLGTFGGVAGNRTPVSALSPVVAARTLAVAYASVRGYVSGLFRRDCARNFRERVRSPPPGKDFTSDNVLGAFDCVADDCASADASPSLLQRAPWPSRERMPVPLLPGHLLRYCPPSSRTLLSFTPLTYVCLAPEMLGIQII